MSDAKVTRLPRQHQDHQPGREHLMRPAPEYIRPTYRGSGKLEGKVAVITGGDSGIGRSVAIHYAREGADVAVVYLEEHRDAEETRKLVHDEGRRCLLIPGDLRNEAFCFEVVRLTLEEFRRIDILVNNAGEHTPKDGIREISAKQIEQTFRTNIFSYFYLTQATLPHLHEGSAIINTSSVTAYKGSAHLLDYAATKGAIVSFTRSLSQMLEDRKIRVNGVAPGPIWTPLIAASMSEEKIEKFGQNYPMGRPGQPSEVGPSYVFLASEDSSYMSGQFLHPNGGMIVNA